MIKKVKKVGFQWCYVYRGTNKAKKEIYHGVSKNVDSRIDGQHCDGGTVALAHWNCYEDKIEWEGISMHKTQRKASEISHKLERSYPKRGYENLKTRGI